MTRTALRWTLPCLGLLAVLSALPVPAPAGVPRTVAFQARLLDVLGNPVPGPVALSFALFGSETGGTALWTETQPAVPVLDGVYDVALGSVEPIPTQVLERGSLWLEVTVGGETLAPRTRLHAAPFALRAHTAERLAAPSTSQIGFVRIGEVEGSVSREESPQYEGWSRIRALSWGVDDGGDISGPGGGGTSLPGRTDFTVAVADEQVLPRLSALAAAGRSFDDATVVVGPANGPAEHSFAFGRTAIRHITRSVAMPRGEPGLADVALSVRSVTLSSAGGDPYGFDFSDGTETGTRCSSAFTFIRDVDSGARFDGIPNPVFVSSLALASVGNPVDVLSGGGGGAFRPSFGPMEITLPYDSPCLLSHLLAGTHLGQLSFQVWTTTSSTRPETQILLDDASLAEVQVRSTGAGLEQTASFRYSRITWRYLDRPPEFWDLETNTGSQ